MKRFIKILLALLIISIPTKGIATPEYRGNDLRTLFLNNKAIIYGVNLRTFNAKDLNGNDIIEPEKGEESGTFLNAIQRLNELQNEGINTIHLLPITPTGKIKALGTAGSVYSMSDITSLNPQLVDKKSSMSALTQARAFVDECHARNIRVIVDLPSCGSYEMFIKNPDLFLQDKNQEPVIPADWTDVRLFKTQNDNGSLNEDLLEAHKKFINMVFTIGADGIRADVATIKPYDFWVQIIKYARSRDPEFLFLAESSDSWTEPASDKAVFTNYEKLLQAGFDGYYSSYFELKNWTSSDQLKKQVEKDMALNNAKTGKKAAIGSFATHDELSPILTSPKLSEIMIWLNATLPLNPYYIDGFPTGDSYLYKYSNKKADVTYTDDDFYHVHRGKIDIFNFSRKPGGTNTKLQEMLNRSIRLKTKASNVISKGNFNMLNIADKQIFAYTRDYEGKGIIVIINTNLKTEKNYKITIRKLKKNADIIPVNLTNAPLLTKNTLRGKLSPGECVVFYSENFSN
ncbi:MAG: hypothetical protein PHV37_05935 [Candidatus Gastranaerophilales bacterium]|nr:hypothetical protein [Candidatus Gastranaerophilales bacterium]